MSEFKINSLGNNVRKDQLRVYRSLQPELDARTHDFTILGFRKLSPKYDRGRKIEARYLCASGDDLIVRKIFRDERDPQTGRLTGLLIDFEFMTEDDKVGLSYTEKVKSFNEWESATEERKRRERQRDFLIAEGIRSGASSHFDLMFTFHKLEIDKYIGTGSDAWANAIQNHQPKFINDDPNQGVDQAAIETQVYGILNARPEGELTVGEAILYQIAGILPGT